MSVGRVASALLVGAIVGTGAVVGVAGPAQAVETRTDWGEVTQATPIDMLTTIEVPPFDASLGELRAVELLFSGDAVSQIAVENSVEGPLVAARAGVTTRFSITPFVGAAAVPAAGSAVGSTGGIALSAGEAAQIEQTATTGEIAMHATDLSAWLGPDTVAFQADAYTQLLLSDESEQRADWALSGNATTTATVTIRWRYVYDTERGPVTGGPRIVTPAAPSITVPACGQFPSIVVPDPPAGNPWGTSPSEPTSLGSVYTEDWAGETVTVTATPRDGVEYPADTVASWTFPVPPYERCPVAVAPPAPTFVPAASCGVEATVALPQTPQLPYPGYPPFPGFPGYPGSPHAGSPGTGATPQAAVAHGVVYEQTRTGATVTVTATPLPGYLVADGAVSSWEFEIPAVVACELPGSGDAAAAAKPAPASELALTGGTAPTGALWIGGGLLAMGIAACAWAVVSRIRRSRADASSR